MVKRVTQQSDQDWRLDQGLASDDDGFDDDYDEGQRGYAARPRRGSRSQSKSSNHSLAAPRNHKKRKAEEVGVVIERPHQ